MPRKTQPPQQPNPVAPEVTPQEAPKAVVTDSNESASPVTKASPKPIKVVELPNGVTIETY